MPSYTNSLRLVQPATGEYSGTWGTEVNNGLTALVDASIAGTSNITMTAGNFTLTSNNGAADQSRAMFLVLGGTPGGSYQVICPAVSKLYFVTNNTGFAQTVKTASGSGVSVPNAARMTLRCDGTDVVAAENYFASLTLGAALPATSGGTGSASAFTANGVVYASSTSALATGSGLVFNGTNLGIGTSSPGEKLAINQGNIYASNSGGAKIRLADQNNEVSIESWPVGGASSMVFATNNIERMRINSSGNLGIGTSSPTTRLEVNGIVSQTTQGTSSAQYRAVNSGGTFYYALDSSTGASFGAAYAAAIWHSGNYPMLFATNNIERARITSGGDFGINGTPPNDSQFYSKNDGANRFAGTFENHSASGWGMSIGTASTVLAHFYPNAIRTGSPVGGITTNGTSTSYVTSSDRRLKDNIVPAPSASDVIDAIEIVSHDWKAAPDEHVTYGVIAQDLHAVVPQAVLQGDDGEEVEKTWGVDYSKLVPMLIKEIQSLRARVAALEQA
jgi:hypothetical protein